MAGGAESEPTYSRLIRVEFYENNPVHIHSFGQWMVTTEPTCEESGIKTRECDCGVTERAEVPAVGHNWDAGTITREPTPKADGEKTYSCLVCKATMTEPVKYSGSLEGDNDEKSSVEPEKDMSTDLKDDHEKNTEHNSPVESERFSFPWWIVAVIAAAVIGAIRGADLTIALWSVGQMLLNMYLTLFILGAITTVTEWRRIHTKAVKKVIYAFTFPLFMFTYIPISFAAIFCKGEWKPIEHRVSAASLRGRGREELLPF